MGPIQRADSRKSSVKRMLALMTKPRPAEQDLIVYPESHYNIFPRWYMEDQAEVDTGLRARCRMQALCRCSRALRNIRWR